jgi:monoamine oxidase
MIRHLSKRAFLAGSASLAGAKALGQVPASGVVEVAIIGAGAAGLAAARRVAMAGRNYALLEASNRTGGRVWTAPGNLGIAHDRGAHFMSASGRNPLVAIGRLDKLELKNVSPFRRMYVGSREARDSEYDAFTAALRRAGRAIAAAGEAGRDIAASQAMPDMGDWNATAGFVLGPHALSKDLNQVSTVDFSRIEDQPEEIVCRTGLGQVLAASAKSLRVTLDAPVTRVGQIGRGTITVESARGVVRAETVIVTVSTNVLASGRIRFESPLPKRTLDAVEALSLGTRDRLIFELKGNPFKFTDDQKIIFKGTGPNAISLVGRAGGTDLCFAEFSGNFGRGISSKGQAAMAAFVAEQFVEHFGTEAKKHIGRAEAVRWSGDPLILGGTSVAAPGRGGSRRILMEPLFDRMFLAGEAVHETWFGTVAGAWVSGERAADAALRHFAPKTAPAKGKK